MQRSIHTRQLSGQDEVPAVETSATGEAEFTIPANDTMKFRVNVTGITRFSSSYHMGKPEEWKADCRPFECSRSKDKTSLWMISEETFLTLSEGALQGKTLDDLAAAMNLAIHM